MLVSYCCYKKLLQIEQLKAVEIYYDIILEIRILK